MPRVIEDFSDKISQIEKGISFMDKYGDTLNVKELLEMIRRAGITVNNNASYRFMQADSEGQGLKVIEEIYVKYKTENTPGGEIISQKLLDYLTEKSISKDYKIQVSVDNPEEAIILNSLRLHMQMTIDDSEDDKYIYLVGNFTSAKGPSVFKVIKKQKFYDISKTEDKSKQPQIVENYNYNNS